MTTTTLNLFATATKVKEKASKTDKKVIKAPNLTDKVKRYADLLMDCYICITLLYTCNNLFYTDALSDLIQECISKNCNIYFKFHN